MKSLIIGLLGAVAMSVATPTLAKDWSNVVIGMDLSYKPWAFTDSNGTFMGFEVDLANDLCERMKVKCELTSQAWDSIIPSLEAGKFDAIIAGMAITPKRLEVINFSIPYADSPRVLLTLKDSPYAKLALSDKIFDIENGGDEAKQEIELLRTELKGATLGVLTATANVKFIETYLGDVIEMRQYKTAEQYVLDLAAGRIDIALDNLAYLGGVLAGPDGGDMVIVGPKLSGGMFGVGRGVGLRKSDTDLKELFDKAIEEAKQDGTIAKISDQWFGVNVAPQ